MTTNNRFPFGEPYGAEVRSSAEASPMPQISMKGMIYMTNIARNIRSLRERRDLSQKELSEKSGVSTGYICMCEKGDRIPSVKLCIKLAKALDCRLSDILDERSAG